jgi:hypothetical protein
LFDSALAERTPPPSSEAPEHRPDVLIQLAFEASIISSMSRPSMNNLQAAFLQ